MSAISQHHLAQLRESGLSDDIISERGCFTATTSHQLIDIGFSKSQAVAAPALTFPIYNTRGEIAFYQIRPDTPRILHGRAMKYETPRGARMALDISPRCQPYIGDPNTPLWIAEGIKKVMALAMHGCVVVGVTGVWNWRGKNDLGGLTALSDWEFIHLKGRVVYLCFDSDVMEKREVHLALSRLKQFLDGRGAKTKIIYLPHGDDGKTGVDDYLAAGHTINDLLSLASDKLKPLDEPMNTTPDDGRPVITHNPTDIKTSVDGIISALMASGCDIYQRDGRVVVTQISKRKASHGVKEDIERLRIVQPEESTLVELATTVANHRVPSRYARGKQYYKPGACPRHLIATMLSRGEKDFPILSGVTEVPTLRADGSIITKSGYDSVTGLYYQAQRDYPYIETATLDGARRAMDTLREPFQDFPFAEPYHESAAIAAVLSISARHLIRTSPLFAITANVRGSGKSLLSNVISVIAMGREPGKSSAGRDDEETRKQLLTFALNGDKTIIFDNVQGSFGTPSLDRCLTQSLIADRLLGKNETAEVELRAVFFLTGNNVAYHGDMARRVIPIELSPECERPEERDGFKHGDLLGWVQEHQPTLLCASLTILRGYILAGKPKQDIPNYGGFEEWSNLVRSSIVWAGMPDPSAGRKAVEIETDKDFEELRTLLYAWETAFGGQRQILKNVVDAVKDETISNPKLAALGEALTAFDPMCKSKIQDLSPRRLGQRMRFNSGKSRIINGLRLRSESDDSSNKGKLWWIDRLSGSEREVVDNRQLSITSGTPTRETTPQNNNIYTCHIQTQSAESYRKLSVTCESEMFHDEGVLTACQGCGAAEYSLVTGLCRDCSDA